MAIHPNDVGPTGPEGPVGPPNEMNDLTEFGAGVAVAQAGIEIRRGDPAYFASRPSLLIRTGTVAGSDAALGLFAVQGGGTGITWDKDHTFGMYMCGQANNPDSEVTTRLTIATNGLLRYQGTMQVDDDLTVDGGNILIDSDQYLAMGPQAGVSWQTADASAPYTLLNVPAGSGVLVGGPSALGNDLGIMDGISHPYLGAISDNDNGATYLIHDNSDGHLVTTAGDLLLKPASGHVGIGDNALPKAPLHVGNSPVNQSVDAQVLVSRTVNNADGASGNGHCFSDSSSIDRSGVIGYNSMDCRISVAGTYDYDHFALFQALPQFGTTGTTGIVYGLVDQIGVTAGTVTNRYGLYFGDYTGAGAVTEQAAVYVEDLTKAGTNYAIQTAGTTPSSFGGSVGVGGLTVDDGYLFHRQMTTAQRTAATPAEGAMVHDTDLQQLWIYLNGTWKLIA